jgi:hypothetical protein
MSRSWSKLSNLWCYFMHGEPLRPVNGHYRCPDCYRLYPVPWETGRNRFETEVRTEPAAAVIPAQPAPATSGVIFFRPRRKAAA